MNPKLSVSRFTASELARRVGAELEGDGEAVAGAIVVDSREAREGGVFFALDGSRVRGAQFVSHAFESGCSIAVVPRDWRGTPPPARAALRCRDPLMALGALAAWVRAQWSGPVIAITGSSGKTSVKEMTAHALESKWNVVRSPGNFNTVLGISQAILAIESPPEIAVLELGASLPGEIARLARIVQPSAAAVTNVSAAHLEGFGTVAAVRQEKLELARAVPEEGVNVIDGDDPELAAAAPVTARTVRVGFADRNDVQALESQACAKGGMTFRLASGEQGTLRVPGAHQVKNALFALALAEAHGVSREEALERLATFQGVGGRLELRERGGVRIADDTYNANPASMRASLEWFANVAASGRKAVALGDMLELGQDSQKYHESVGRHVAALPIELVVFVGPESRAAYDGMRESRAKDVRHVADSEEGAKVLQSWVRPGDFVLVKGSRGMCMERIVQALMREGESDAV